MCRNNTHYTQFTMRKVDTVWLDQPQGVGWSTNKVSIYVISRICRNWNINEWWYQNKLWLLIVLICTRWDMLWNSRTTCWILKQKQKHWQTSDADCIKYKAASLLIGTSKSHFSLISTDLMMLLHKCYFNNHFTESIDLPITIRMWPTC